jgi:hypothetical protein
MLGLPKKTEMNKLLSKKAVFENFKLNTATREKFNVDISKMVIVNEISPMSTTIADGETIHAFFVVRVTLKTKDFDEKNIGLITKLIQQNLIFILVYEDMYCLAVYKNGLMQTDWQPSDSLVIKLDGLNFDSLWENLLIKIAGIELEAGNSLDEQLVLNQNRLKLEKQINVLQKQARSEKQPKKKYEIFQMIQKLIGELELLK